MTQDDLRAQLAAIRASQDHIVKQVDRMSSLPERVTKVEVEFAGLKKAETVVAQEVRANSKATEQSAARREEAERIGDNNRMRFGFALSIASIVVSLIGSLIGGYVAVNFALAQITAGG